MLVQVVGLVDSPPLRFTKPFAHPSHRYLRLGALERAQGRDAWLRILQRGPHEVARHRGDPQGHRVYVRPGRERDAGQRLGRAGPAGCRHRGERSRASRGTPTLLIRRRPDGEAPCSPALTCRARGRWRPLHPERVPRRSPRPAARPDPRRADNVRRTAPHGRARAVSLASDLRATLAEIVADARERGLVPPSAHRALRTAAYGPPERSQATAGARPVTPDAMTPATSS